MEQHILNKYFDKIFCIVRSDEPDNAEAMRFRFEKLGIKVEYWYGTPLPFYELLKNGLNSLNNKFIKCASKGHIGATLSHLSIIKYAKDLGLKNVFIFEHQNMFRKDFNEIIDKYINSIPEDFDVAYLFSNFWEWTEHNQWVVDDLWFTPYASLCNNAYGINAKFFDIILNEYEKHYSVIDGMTAAMQTLNKYKFIASYPNLCSQEIQIAGTSEDVPGGYHVNVFDYNPNFGGFSHKDFF